MTVNPTFLAGVGLTGLLVWFFAGPNLDVSPEASDSATATAPLATPHDANERERAPAPPAESTTPPAAPSPEAKPLTPPSRKDRTLFQQTIGDHFQTHPDTEERIWHLRGGRRNPTSLIELVNDMKNNGMRGGSELFTAIVGPLTLEDEWRYGQEVHEAILKEVEIDKEASARLIRLAQPFLDKVTRTKGQPYTFTVIKSDDINAFAHLGGHVYFYTGLLDKMTTDREVEFVLGHEIGHVETAHCANGALPGIAARRHLGTFAKAPIDFLNHYFVKVAYSPKDELDADMWSYRIMRAYGASERDSLAFLQKLLLIEQQLAAQASAKRKTALLR